MKDVDDYLFIDFIKVQEGVYIAPPENFWTFLSAGETIEEGICDWWYDVASEYPNSTIVFYPVDTGKESIPMNKYTLYRGVKELDEDPEILCYYKVIG